MKVVLGDFYRKRPYRLIAKSVVNLKGALVAAPCRFYAPSSCLFLTVSRSFREAVDLTCYGGDDTMCGSQLGRLH